MQTVISIAKEAIRLMGNGEPEQDEPRFKEVYSLDERKTKFEKLKKKHPDLIPIICDKKRRISYAPRITTQTHDPLTQTKKKKTHFLVRDSIKVFELTRQVMQFLSMNDNEAMYFTTEGHIVLKTTLLMSEVYEKYKDEDGFLYLEYFLLDCYG